MHRFQVLIQNKDVEHLGFLCRLINFLEDVAEDAECRDIVISRHIDGSTSVIIKPVDCKYDIAESINHFADYHDVGRVVVDKALEGSSYRRLYDEIVSYYLKTMHNILIEYAEQTDRSSIEYFLGVLFDGVAFVIEGEREKVVLPSLPLCISTHTHPRGILVPSLQDIKMIITTLVERGIGHVIASSTGSLVIYRRKPLSLEDYFFLKSLENRGDPVSILEKMAKENIVVVKRA